MFHPVGPAYTPSHSYQMQVACTVMSE